MGSISISNLKRKKHITSVDLHFVRKNKLPSPQILPGWCLTTVNPRCQEQLSQPKGALLLKRDLAPQFPPAPLLFCFPRIGFARFHQDARWCSPNLLKAISTHWPNRTVGIRGTGHKADFYKCFYPLQVSFESWAKQPNSSLKGRGIINWDSWTT